MARQRCYPLTISDMHSQLLLECEPCTSTAFEHTKPILERALRDHGMPLRMRSDNGPPFGSRGLCGFSRLTVYLAHLGIEQEFIVPGHPQDNGRHERIHRNLKAEAIVGPDGTWADQRRALEAFLRLYNEVRPHEALGMRTPAEMYVGSPRPFPKRLPPLAYHSGFAVRRVRHTGEIKWRGGVVFLGEALAGEDIGLLDTEDDGWWSVQLGQLAAGTA